MRRQLTIGLCTTMALLGAALCATAVPAEAASPWWHVSASTRPASIPVGGEGTVVVRASNLGNSASSGLARISDLLPAGLIAQEEEVGGEMVPKVTFVAFSKLTGRDDLAPTRDPIFGQPLELCSSSGQRVSCQTGPPPKFYEKAPFNEPPLNEPGTKEIVEEVVNGAGVAPLQPYEYIEMRIAVKNEGTAPGAENESEASGGGAQTITVKRTLNTASGLVPFGIEYLSMVPEEEGGDVDTQAGSHPYQFTTEFAFNQTANTLKPPALARNLKFNLPAGLIGNATLLAQCTDLEFRHVTEGGEENLCPANTVVGVALVTIHEPLQVGLVTFPGPDLQPRAGQGRARALWL